MSTYHIAEVERLTGIKAHTIRIWEKRYNLVTPHRTDTNIRYYDDNDLRKLLNISTLLQQGLKISSLSGMTDKEISEHINKTSLQAEEDVITTGYINNLVSFMIGFDEAGFEKTFSSAVNRLGMFQAMIQVFYPFLHKTGVLWSVNEIMPAQEHFAMNIIKRKLQAAIDGLPPATNRSKKFVLFLPPGEWHEISLLFGDYIIRYHGYTSLYLGQSVPYENLEATIGQFKPTHLLGFYISEKNTATIESDIKKLTGKYPKLTVLLAGSSVVNQKLRFDKSVIILEDPLALNKLLA